MTAFKPGDWVASHQFRGVWQVHRVTSDFYEVRWKLSDPKVKSERVLVSMRRLVNDSFKKSFKSDTVEASYLLALSPQLHTELAEFKATQPKVMKAFDAYAFEPRPLIANLGGIRRPHDRPLEEVDRLVREAFPTIAGDGFTLDEVLERVAAPPLVDLLRGTLPGTVQCACNDYELRDGDFVYRSIRVLGH